MASQNDSGFATYTATAVAIAKNTRVKLDANFLISAAAGTNYTAIGTALEDIAASGTGVVKLATAPGTRFVVASVNNIAKGDLLYPAASGQVTNVAGMLTAIGYAREASTTIGDNIEMVPVAGLI